MRKTVKNNVSWIGYMDWELEKFHGDEYSIHNGSSQNAYLIEEEKTVLMDTVWTPHRDEFLNNLKEEIDIKKIDFIVMQHGEADHSGSLPRLMEEIPNTPIYCTAQAVKSLEGQYGKHGWDFHVVKTGDSVEIGNGKKLIFIEMKMLHWPDSMATYMTGDNILFSMDAFGQHFAVEEMFNDLADQCLLYKEAMKYFVNILHPFTSFIPKKLEEIESFGLPIDIIAPSHGVVWRDNPMQIVEKYSEWADSYQEDQITVCYDTMWDGTKKLAHAIAKEINIQSPSTVVKVLNLAKTDKNDVMTEVFKSKAIAVGSPTCVNSILTNVAAFFSFLKELKFKNKKAAAFGCYGWSGESVKIIKENLAAAGFEVCEAQVRSNWNPEDADYALIPGLVKELLGNAEAADNSSSAQETVKAGSEEYVVTKSTGGYRRFKCKACGWIYDEALGVPEMGIAPGTKWEDLPDDFKCAVCKVPKSMFEEIEGAVYRKFMCKACGWIYDEAFGVPEMGIKAGTRWEELPDDFKCAVCKVPKSMFEEVKTGGETAKPAAENTKAATAEASKAEVPADLAKAEPDVVAEKSADGFKKYVCQLCGWVYDEAAGAPEMGIKAGTKWEELPSDFKCAICKAPKSMFKPE